MEFRIKPRPLDQRHPNGPIDPRTVCPACKGGILELQMHYRAKSNLVFSCKRCKTGVAVPSRYAGFCRKWSELIEESEVAGYIGPRCVGCSLYDDSSQNPAIHPVLLKRCPMLDTQHVVTKTEFEKFLEVSYGGVRDIDPVESRKEAMKRLGRLPELDFIPP